MAMNWLLLRTCCSWVGDWYASRSRLPRFAGYNITYTVAIGSLRRRSFDGNESGWQTDELLEPVPESKKQRMLQKATR